MSEKEHTPWLPEPSWPKVLIIDDYPYTAELIIRDLLRDHINVLTSRTLDEGFEMALRVRPDLIVVDYRFNGETGLDFASRLDSDPRLVEIPRIMLTEREVNLEFRRRAAEEGYLTCVQKPKFDRGWAELFRSFMK